MNQPRTSAAVADGSIAFPLLLAVLAPMAVVVSLLSLHSVWWAFATYQVGICLVVPGVESRRARRSWREHAELLGLIQAPGTDRPGRMIPVAISLGLATAAITVGFLIATRETFLSAGRLEEAVAGWGVGPDQILPMLVFMALINSPAEELFWRGYLPGRIQLARPGSRPPALLTIVLPAILYASYHAATLNYLVGKFSGVVVMTGGILAGGVIWGWLRLRTGSVWPPLLSHSGAVIGYLAVYLWLTG